MSIEFKCVDCGKGYAAPDHKAGKQFKCRQCGAAVTIPSSSIATYTADLPDFGLDSVEQSSKRDIQPKNPDLQYGDLPLRRHVVAPQRKRSKPRLGVHDDSWKIPVAVGSIALFMIIVLAVVSSSLSSKSAAHGAQLVGQLVCPLAMLPLAAAVWACFLRAAVWLYNKLAGGAASTRSVPEPGFGRAMLIATATNLVVLSCYTVAVVFAASAAAVVRRPEVALVSVVFVGGIPLVVQAGMLTVLLPTSFARAFLVVLCQSVFVIVVAIVVGAVVFGAAVFFSILR